MNCYDFDMTIYDGDSTVDFYRYCVKRHPSVLLSAPLTLAAGTLFGLRLLPKTRFKQIFYRFLRHLPDGERAVGEFWHEHFDRIKGWYLGQKQDSDLVISASPEFLLFPVCEKLGVGLIASRVDIKTGLYTGLNCGGAEKVTRLKQSRPDFHIEKFYSDSFSDTPLAKLAGEAFMVKGNAITPWDFTKKYKSRP